MVATLKDIAALVGLSVNSVSRALNDKSDISPATRERVKKAARALGYRPNLSARSLILKKSNIVGVAMIELDNPVFITLCEELRRLAEADGYRLLTVGLSHSHDEAAAAAIEELLSRNIDGLIMGVIAANASERPVGRALAECRERGIPVTVFGDADGTDLADCAYIDHRESGAIITEHFLERGIVPTAFLQKNSILAYCLGYERAMTAYGLADQIRYWPPERHGLHAGRDAIRAYIAHHGAPPAAVMAPNDVTAIGIMAGLQADGYRVPEDVKVAGFDNIDFCEFCNPPLTSIGFEPGWQAGQIWSLLRQRLLGDAEPSKRRVQLHHTLHKRRSTE